jgi:hypothetical protein
MRGWLVPDLPRQTITTLPFCSGAANGGSTCARSVKGLRLYAKAPWSGSMKRRIEGKLPESPSMEPPNTNGEFVASASANANRASASDSRDWRGQQAGDWAAAEALPHPSCAGEQLPGDHGG